MLDVVHELGIFQKYVWFFSPAKQQQSSGASKNPAEIKQLCEGVLDSNAYDLPSKLPAQFPPSKSSCCIIWIYVSTPCTYLYICIYISPLKLPWWGRAPSNCRGTLSFLYKMGGPGWRHLYKMECAKKTLENDRAPTYTGDSWWIEKFDVISIIFGGHMSMYKNKDSFCRQCFGDGMHGEWWRSKHMHGIAVLLYKMSS